MAELLTPSILIPTLIAAIISIILFQLANKEKDLVYDFITLHILDNKIRINEKIKFLYENKEINSLAVTKVSFCNRGIETIVSNDVPDSDKIRVELSGDNVRLLDAEMIYGKRKINKFNFDLNSIENQRYLNFDFIDKNDGVVLQLLHTDSKKVEISEGNN